MNFKELKTVHRLKHTGSNIKKIANWKVLGHNDIWILVLKIHIHSQQINPAVKYRPTRGENDWSKMTPKKHPQWHVCLWCERSYTQIIEKIYYSLENCRLFPKERCRKETQGTNDLWYIDQHLPLEVKSTWEI